MTAKRNKLMTKNMIKNYFKIAFRNFWKHKIFTLINIVGLSIGISAAIAIYLIVSFDFSFDKFHRDNDRIYRVVTDFVFAGEPVNNSGVTGPLPEATKNEVTGLTLSATFYYNSYDVKIDADKKSPVRLKNQQDIIYADQRYFNMFQYTWLAGSPKNALNSPYEVVLTASAAKKYFPSLTNNKIIGRQVVFDDTIKTTVTGIVQNVTQNSDLIFNSFISYATMYTNKDLRDYLKKWASTNGSSQFYVKLAPNTSPQHVEAQLAALLKKYQPTKPEDKGNTQVFRLQPLSDVHFNSKYGVYDAATADKTTLYGLMVIGVFLLLLGCINFINLTTAQASQRAKEIGIRKTMGSTRRQLIIQFLSETFLITLLAVIIAVAATPVILKIFADFISPKITADFIHHPDIIGFLAVLVILVTALSGFYPAMILSGYKPVLVLKNQAFSGTSKTRNAWLRKSLTVSQFVVAQFFMMATILVSKQIYFALHKDLGFKKDAIVSFYTPWKDQSPSHRQLLYDKIKMLPQVAVVSQGGDIPSSDGWNSSDVFYRDGKKEIKSELYRKSGDENYIKVYHIKLLAGRNITMADTAWGTGMLINTTYMHILGFNDPRQVIGRTINFGDTYKKIVVGVFADFHQGSLHKPIKPLAIYPDYPYNFGTFHIALQPQTPGGNEWHTAIAAMQKAYKQIYPDDNMDLQFFDATIAKFYTNEQHTATLLTWATGLSIFISCLGLLGLAIYTTNQRTKEIGVRKVLGASVSQIVTLLSTEMVRLILLAFIIVTPLAWWVMNKWMEGFSDRTGISWWIFAISGAGMLITALFTSGFQTVKAAITNPVKSLRSE